MCNKSRAVFRDLVVDLLFLLTSRNEHVNGLYFHDARLMASRSGISHPNRYHSTGSTGKYITLEIVFMRLVCHHPAVQIHQDTRHQASPNRSGWPL